MSIGWLLIHRLFLETEKLLGHRAAGRGRAGASSCRNRCWFEAFTTHGVLIERVGRGSERSSARSRTIGGIFKSLLTVLVVGTVVLYRLSVMGWDVAAAHGGDAGVALVSARSRWCAT